MRAFLIAGEPSGDALGAALMAGLRARVPGVSFEGVGGMAMAAGGLASRFPMDELSVMGLAEVVPRYPALRRRMVETAEAVAAAAPDVLVTIDSPDFCLRVARRVRASGVRVVHYVAPSVWAWRPGRAAAMAGLVDQVLALLPFEPPYFEAVGLRCDFVGHPAAAMPVAGAGEAAGFRERHGIGGAPLLLALPGSRRSEVARLAPVFAEAAGRLAAGRPGLRVAIAATGARHAELAARMGDWPRGTVLLDPADAGAKRAAFAAADVALAASGTVSLELAAAGTPMVVAYDMAWLSWQVMRRMARVDTVTLANLVSGTRAVPEFLGPDCRAERIAPALAAVLDAPGAQRAALDATMAALGRGGPPPGERAADAVLDGLARG